MKVQVEEITSVKKSLTIEIPQEIVSKAFADAYSDLKKQVKVPGFRPGKAPLSLLEKRYGDSVMNDIIRKLVPDYYQKAVEHTGIFPVEFPSFEKVDAKKDAPLSFTAVVEVKPTITLGNYEGIVLPKQKIEVLDADIDKALEARQEQQSQLEACPDDYSVASLDFAILDFEGFSGGEEIKDGKQKGYTIQVGSNTFPEPFESELLGRKKGDVLDITVPYPGDFQNKAIAGKDVHFHVEVQEVKKKVLPLLDDEFAKDLGLETLDALKAETRERLLVEVKLKAERDQKRQLVDKLITLHPLEIPSALVARELNSIMGSFPDQKTLEGEGDKKDTFMKELEPVARHHVAETLILGKISEKEKIEVSDEEVEKELSSIADSRGRPLQEIKRVFYQKEGALEGLKSQLKEQKALDLVYSKAKLEDVPDAKKDLQKGEKP